MKFRTIKKIFSKDTISGTLLRRILGIYGTFALFITVFEIGFQFRQEKGQVLFFLKEMSNSLRPTLAENLWSISFEEIDITLKGALQNKSVVGIELIDDDGKKRFFGKTPQKKDNNFFSGIVGS